MLRRLNPFRRDRRKYGRRHNPDGTMTLIDHLYELRYRLGVASVAVVIGGVFGFWWFSNTIFAVPSLGDLLTGPYCQLPETLRFSPNEGKCQLLQTKPFETFMIRLKVGTSVGAVVFSPVWLYQFWAFITPGLYDNERKYARTFVAIASVLFVTGGVLAYYVVPEGLAFMAGFGGDVFFTALTGGEYVNFVLLMLFMFGISFELPLVIVMLNRIGVLSYARLKSWWRGLVFGLVVFAAIATPGQEPFSMLVLAACLCLLFGFSMLLCRQNDRRKGKLAQGQDGLGWDDPSDIDFRGSSLDTTPSKVHDQDDVT